jgi:class 3 adenylate cyclase
VFCNRCGAAVPQSDSGVDTRSADSTTTAVSAAAERRVTSVLFADLVAFTTLAELRDSEDVRSMLTEYFEVCATIVRRYGGTVEKFIGDAVMAVWGVPTSHEDDAERAVRAGLELVNGVATLGERLDLPHLSLRVGIVTGEVAANLVATDQGMVAGDPVNTAARVQSAAGPSQVWVDATTRTLTAAAVTYFDAGEHVLKGKSDPVHLFRAGAVVAARGGSQRVDGLEAALVGRERQLRLLKELFHGTEETGRPAVVVLDGQAGVGKSRLGW